MKEILNQHDYSSVNAGSPEPGGHLAWLCSQDHKQCIQHQPGIRVTTGATPQERAGGIFRFLHALRVLRIAGKRPG